VLANPGRRQQDPLCLQWRPDTVADVAFNLVPKTRLQHRDIQLLLAEQSQLAAVLEAEEVRQTRRPDALGPRRLQQHPVDVREPGRVVAERGARRDVPLGAVGSRAVQVGHLGQHAGRRPGE
jgi:hypothetical protein